MSTFAWMILVLGVIIGLVVGFVIGRATSNRRYVA